MNPAQRQFLLRNVPACHGTNGYLYVTVTGVNTRDLDRQDLHLLMIILEKFLWNDLRALGYKHRYLLWGVAMTFVDGVKTSGGLASVGETSGDLSSGGKTSCDGTSADEWREDERRTSKRRASGGGRQVAG